MIPLRGELTRFNIYVGNYVHQYISAKPTKFAKLHNLYILKCILTKL